MPDPDRRPVPVGMLVAAGLGLAPALGAIDVAVSLRTAPGAYAAWTDFLPVLTASVVAVFVVFVLAGLVALFVGVKLFRFSGIALTGAWGSFFAILLTLAAAAGILGGDRGPGRFLILLLALAVATVSAVTTYIALEAARIGGRTVHEMLNIVTVAATLIAFETLVLGWYRVYRFDDVSRPTLIAIAAVFFLAVAATIWIVVRFRRNRLVHGLPPVLFGLIVMSSAVTLFSARVAASPRNGSPDDPVIRHVILLTVDTLRADALSSFGGNRAQTPALDALAANSRVYLNARAPSPWTLPSVVTMMTGLPPDVHGATTKESRLPEAASTLAERLRDVGYATVAIGQNYLLTPRYHLSDGFETYRWFPAPRRGHSLGESVLDRLLGRVPWRIEWATTEELTDLAIRFVEARADEPLFLWFHILDPHVPYTPRAELLPASDVELQTLGVSANYRIRTGAWAPTPEERSRIEQLYFAEVRQVDENVGRFLDALRRLGLYDDALIVFASDHGEEFWEHDGWEHGHSLYDELLRVPLMVKPPGRRSHAEIATPVTVASVAPTILGLCGLPTKPHDLAAAILPQSSPTALDGVTDGSGGSMFATSLLYFEDRETVMLDGFKFIRTIETHREELYDLIRDPSETENIAAAHPQVVEMANSILDDRRERVARVREELGIEDRQSVLDPESLEQLRSLGYLH